MQSTIEKVGHSYTEAGMLESREKTWSVINKVRTQVKPGMLESDAKALTENLLKEFGSDKNWHRTWVRFGENTVLSYGELAKPDTELKENDIFFLDLGPVFNGFEGDAGITFTVGNDPEMLKCEKDVKRIFDLTKKMWAEEKLTGEDLYAYAEKKAQELGWIFSLKGASGHRLSDFPHAIHHKGPIKSLEFSPSPFLWVLEIQIRHPSRTFGAFYEDLLVP